ncbi:MAG: maleylpyruvate isomerase N-terminal domain-containing protein [Chloroflexi bacterium]|nr:maleylpyruvate isomerase N-terminal domain-containing protein [Chloroflexota bacterium]
MAERIRHTRAATLARVRGEWRALDKVLSGLTPTDFRRPVFQSETKESWTIKDAIAHVTAWKWNVHASLVKGPRPYPSAGTVHATNKRIYERWLRTSGRAVVADARAAHEAVVKALRAMPADYFSGKTHSVHWPFDLVGHSTEHRVRHLERTLGNKTAPRRVRKA